MCIYLFSVQIKVEIGTSSPLCGEICQKGPYRNPWRPIHFSHEETEGQRALTCFSSSIWSYLVTEWQLKPGCLSLPTPTSESVLPVPVASHRLPRVSDLFFTYRFFRNQLRNSSTSWLRSPRESLAPWLSSSRQQKPWKVSWILSCHLWGSVAAPVQRNEQRAWAANTRPFLANSVRRNTLRYLCFLKQC